MDACNGCINNLLIPSLFTIKSTTSRLMSESFASGSWELGLREA